MPEATKLPLDPPSDQASVSEQEKSTDKGIRASPMTIDRLGAISAVIASFSLALSFAYDWGFFSGLGISFAEAPTALTDHLRTWLVWLPVMVPGLLLVLVLEVLTRRDESGMRQDEITKSHQRSMRLVKWIGPGSLAIWLLMGDTFLLVLGAGVCWMWFMTWVFRHPILKLKYPPLFKLIAVVGPQLLAGFYWMGYSASTPDYFDVKAHVESEEDGLDINSSFEEVNVLRSFDGWLVVLDVGDGVRWVRSEQVQRIEVLRQERSSFSGLLCIYFNVCTGSEEGGSLPPTDLEPVPVVQDANEEGSDLHEAPASIDRIVDAARCFNCDIVGLLALWRNPKADPQ